MVAGSNPAIPTNVSIVLFNGRGAFILNLSRRRNRSLQLHG